jgi:hypothetical protein
MTLTYQGRTSGEVFNPSATSKAAYILSASSVVHTIVVRPDSTDEHPEKSYLRYIFSGSFGYDSAGKLVSSEVADFSFSVWSPREGINAAWSLHFDIPAKKLPHEFVDLSSATTVNYSYRSSGNGKPSGHKLLESYPISNNVSVLSGYPWSLSISDGWWNDPYTSSLDSTSAAASPVASTNLVLDGTYSVSSVVNLLTDSDSTFGSISLEITAKSLVVTASTWTGSISINFAAKASSSGDRLDAKQIDFNSTDMAGSVMQGGNSNDQLWGKAGWDILDGGAGNDLIRAGNGRDIIIGGLGADELHGDFGWNTYKSEKDGFSDLIAIKSDQSLVNWLYGKAGNNPDGAKCDIIEGLDAIDKIKIIGCATSDLSFAGTTAKGLAGIGIYAKGALEALYTGGDLSLSQIQAMTTGDASAAAMANQIASYGWTWV